MKKFLILLFLCFILVACSDEERSFSIDNVSIEAQINKDGIIHVRELFTYTFNGSYEGMTRAIESDVQNFEAYLTEDNNPDDPQPLTVEEEDDTFMIYSDSSDETKQVLYSYTVEDSVKKYADVADLKYAFFDDSNETDLHNVEISVHPPGGTSTENMHYFLHEDEAGNLAIADNSIEYTNLLLEAGETSMIRFVFPADQLTGMELDTDKAMEAEILAAEQELAERAANLEERMGDVIPIVLVLIGALILVTIFILIIHPNRYRGDKGEDALLRLFEKTDPLFVKFLHGNRHLPIESFVPALFSLKQRGIITLEEVPSLQSEEENTFRLTWVKEDANLDEADQFLRSWLFTERDEAGDYFLLETLADSEAESEEVKKEKAEQFGASFDQWCEKVKERDSYKRLRNPFKGYSFFSIPLLIISLGLFYYFTTIDTISRTEQWVLPIVAGILTIVSLVFNRIKWVLFPYYFIIVLMTAIGFTPTPAVILTLIFYGLALLSLLVIPAYYWNKDIRELKCAIRKANSMFRKNRYPIGADPDKVERRLEYAITLDVGEKYGELCGKDDQFSVLDVYYPLLNNPVYATTAFSTTSLVPVALASNSTSTSTTTTGGGGAGAF